ncbi:hypothetical protein AVEN_168445-1 [Araneus ventricosus]|uniref:Uncharacterized protein n=1 Tax=Araneus ventricosus TaxID=182803 RepID=A0A4Y2GQX6_ARAVE|nr:hypothetical protein AVEN_168445-1 [Araneus ventricosus]
MYELQMTETKTSTTTQYRPMTSAGASTNPEVEGLERRSCETTAFDWMDVSSERQAQSTYASGKSHSREYLSCYERHILFPALDIRHFSRSIWAGCVPIQLGIPRNSWACLRRSRTFSDEN